MPNRIDIVLSATGAETIARVFEDLSTKGKQFATDLAAGAKRMDAALGSSRGALSEVSGLLAHAGVSTGIFGQALGALTSPLGLAAAGFVGLALGIKQATAAMEENFKEVRQLQAVTGLTVEAADNLADTFKVLGIESNTLTGAMFKMGSEIEDGGKTLRLLGIDVRDAAGALKVEGEVFLEIRDRLAQIGSAAERNALGIQIFGRQFRELAPVFALSRTEFMKFRDEASKLSGWTEESQKAAGEYVVAINKLSLAWGDFWNQAGIALAGPATKILDFFTKAIQRVKAYTKSLQDAASAGGMIGGLQLPPVPGPFPGETGGEPGTGRAAVPTISLKAQQALKDFQKQLEVLRASEVDQPIVKLNQAFAEFAQKEGPAAAAAMRPLVEQMIALTRVAQAAPAQLAAMKVTLGDAFGALAEAQLLLDLTGVDDDLKALSVTLGANRDEVQKDADAWREEQEAVALAVEALKQIGPLGKTIEAAFDIGGARFTDELIDANRELRALTAIADLDADAIRRFGVSFGLLDEATQQSLLSLRAWHQEAGDIRGATAYQDALTAINVQAHLFGDRVDAVGERTRALQGYLLDLARASRGEVTPAMRELATELDALRDFQDMRDMFQDIFSSVGSAINTLVQGVILGTQTMAEAFKKLGQSIVVEFVNRVIQQALNPLVKAAAGVVATLLTPSGSSAAADGASGGGAGSDAGGGFNIPTGTGSIAGLFDPSRWSTLASVWDGLATGWEAGEGVFAGVTGAASGAWDALLLAAEGASTLSVGLAGVGAAIAAFGTVMDLINGKTSAGVGGLVGGAIVGAAGAYFAGPFGALLGYALGDLIGSWIGGLFGGGPSHYDLTRMAAADQANQALGRVGGGYQAGLQTGTPASILAALQGGGGGAAGNSVRTELVLPSTIAGRIGLTGQQIGDQVVTQWKDVTLEQFQQVLAAFKGDPGLIQSLRGSGDVPFLEGGDATVIAEQIRQGAIAMLTAFDAVEGVKDKIRTLASDLSAAAKDILPPDLANQFASGILDPIRDRMLAVFSSGLPVAEMQKQLDALAADLQAQTQVWAQFGQVLTQAIDVDALLYGLTGLGEAFRAQMQPEYDEILAALVSGNSTVAQALIEDFQKQLATWAAIGKTVSTIEQELASVTGDPMAQLHAWKAVEAQMTRTVERTGAAWERAIASGDLERIAAASAAYHEATIARLQAEQQIVEQIQAAIHQAEAAIQATLHSAATLVQAMTKVAAIDISQGNLGSITDLLAVLGHTATSAESLTTRLWAVNAGLEAIIGTLPAAVETFGAGAAPSQITGAVIGGAAPFLGALQAAIDAATGGDKLALLQQQAAAWTALAEATVAAINPEQAIQGAKEVAQATIDGLTAVKDAELARIDLDIEGIQTAADAAHEARMAQIEDIQRVADMEHEARQSQLESLREQIAKAKELESAVDSMGTFIAGLRQGPLGPGNNADKLRMAQDDFTAALAAYNATPTAGGLTNLQGLAQQLLQLGETVHTKPSPVFQQMAASILAQLEAAKALAAQQMTDSALLQSQVDALVALDQTASQAAKDQIAAMQAADKAATDAAQAQIAALTAQKATITADFETQTKAIQDALQTQITAIEDAANKEIAEINAGLSAALKANFEAQGLLIGQQLDKQEAILKALTSAEFEGVSLGDIAVYAARRQDVAIGVLEQIRTALNAVIPAETGLARVTEGLYHLHDGEMVVPRAMADQIRSAADGAGLPTNWVGGIGSHEAAWEEHVHYRRDGTAIYAPGYGPGRSVYGPNGLLYTPVVRIGGALSPPPPLPPTPPPPMPPLAPSPAPPPIVEGPGWLAAASGRVASAAATQIEVVVQLDGKEIGRTASKVVIPDVETSARSGRIHQIIVETRPR